jgi:RNA polymerase-binding transcription factor DksA
MAKASTWLSPADKSELAQAIESERARTERRLAASRNTWDEIVRSSEGSPPDDEHDPEGSTIGFERAQVGALIEHDETYLGELQVALQQLKDDDYGLCEHCGRPIALERLVARPTARTCVACARLRSY